MKRARDPGNGRHKISAPKHTTVLSHPGNPGFHCTPSERALPQQTRSSRAEPALSGSAERETYHDGRAPDRDSCDRSGVGLRSHPYCRIASRHQPYELSHYRTTVAARPRPPYPWNAAPSPGDGVPFLHVHVPGKGHDAWKLSMHVPRSFPLSSVASCRSIGECAGYEVPRRQRCDIKPPSGSLVGRVSGRIA